MEELTFKHCKPRKYSRAKRYAKGKLLHSRTHGILHGEICANCGKPFGEHLFTTNRCKKGARR